MFQAVRIARPVSDLTRATEMYTRGLDLSVLGGFEDHEGFDGVMLGAEGQSVHFELTHCRSEPVEPSPTPEDLVVLYVRSAADWQARCETMLQAGFAEVASFNPYWDRHGRTFVDLDGYRVVIHRGAWPPATG
jgi:hypothetical protein